MDFCWLFCPLKLDLESKVPIPSASRSFFTRIPNLCHRYPECYFPDRASLAQIGVKPSPLKLHEKLDLHKFAQCKYGAKKVQTRRKSEAKMANQALAYPFTWGCKFVGKCGIYHLWPWFNLTAHFFAPYLHWINLVKINFFVQWWVRSLIPYPVSR